MDDHEEIIRSRERLHKMESGLVAIDWRLQIIEQRIKEIAPRIDQLARADEIADAVQTRIGSDRRVRFTKFQRLAAYVAAAVVLVEPALRIVAQFSH